MIINVTYPNIYLISVLKFIKNVKGMPNLALLVVLFIMGFIRIWAFNKLASLKDTKVV